MNAAAPRKAPARDDSPAPVVSARQKQDLRARAHQLQPIVQIGHGGVHDAAIAAVRRALLDHELIKVRLHEPEDKRSMAAALAEGARAVLCGLVGHTVILYKPKPKPKPKSKRSAG
jgi:RNA-binding protein